MHEIIKRYGRTGHLYVGFGTQPEFDENANRVAYKITVKEGPQYRMGKLTIKGLSEAESKALEESWKLKAAEVFDTSYFDRFFKTDARAEMQRIFLARQAQGKGPPQARPEVVPNRQTLTVDVTIEFKD